MKDGLDVTKHIGHTRHFYICNKFKSGILFTKGHTKRSMYIPSQLTLNFIGCTQINAKEEYFHKGHTKWSRCLFALYKQ